MVRCVRTACVVEVEVLSGRGLGGHHGVVGTQVELFVLNGFLQAPNERIVMPRAGCLHADSELHDRDEACRSKLRSLVRVEDLENAVPGDHVLDAEVRSHALGDPPGPEFGG